MSKATKKQWKRLFEMMNGFVHTQTLAAACELGLFAYLAANPGAGRQQIQAALSLSEHSTRILMLACCATELVRRDARTLGYFNSDLVAMTLLPGSPECAAPFALFTNKIMERCGMHLAQCLREQRNAALDREFPGEGATLYERLGHYPELARLFQEAMGFYSRTSYSLDQLREFREIRRLLDVGGGNGSNAVKLCRRFRRLRVTVMELPKGCEIGRGYVAERGLGDRIDFAERDMFAAPFPTGCDGVLLAHVTGIFARESVAVLYRKAFDCLPEGGKLIVWSPAANDLETGGIEAAKLSLYFLTTASGVGAAWSFEIQQGLLRQCGFRDIVLHEGRREHAMIVATK